MCTLFSFRHISSASCSFTSSSPHNIEPPRDKPPENMAGLQRSSLTFRRSGSSGLVWDGKLMTDDHEQRDQERKELRHSRSVGVMGLPLRRHDIGAEHSAHNSNGHVIRARRVTPAQDPPSPKVHGCIFCGIFREARSSEPSKPRRY